MDDPSAHERPAPAPLFQERPTELLVPDAYRFAVPLLALSSLFALLGWPAPGWLLLGLAVFVGCFFRNPDRMLPADARSVVAAADGRVIEVTEVESPEGSPALRIAVFLSVFNVHVNRSPVAGRVVSVERSGSEYLAAFNQAAGERNVRCDMTLETRGGARVRVSQITGLIARRIVCHPQVGEWLSRGTRYGLIRFGSRTDVWLPAKAEALVIKGDRVRGGQTVVARLPEGLI